MPRLIDMNEKNEPDRPKARQADIRYVLVADTNVERAAICLQSIRPFNLGVLVARDGDEASRILERFGPPLLLIIDLSLSRKDGFSVIEGLRAIDGARTAVIAWSAVREIREFAAHRLAGMNVRVLRGGSAPAVVRAAIERALQHQADAADATDAPITLTPDELHRTMTDLIEKAQDISRTPGIAVYMRTPGGAEFRALVTWTSDELIPNSPYYLPRVFGWIQETGEAVVLPDLTKQPLADVPTTTLQEVVHGLVAVPIMGSRAEILGTICVFDVKPLTLRDVDVDALKALGRSVHFERTVPRSAKTYDERPGAEPAATDRAFAKPSTDTSDASGTSPAIAAIPLSRKASAPGGDLPLVDWPTAVLDRANGEFAGARELARIRREQGQLSVILFDISAPAREGGGAAPAADNLPEAVGDTLLKAIRQADLPIRWTAQEILVLLPGLGRAQAHAVAERVRAALHAGASYSVSVAGGVAELEADDTLSGVVARARERVRLALERGHNRVA